MCIRDRVFPVDASQSRELSQLVCELGNQHHANGSLPFVSRFRYQMLPCRIGKSVPGCRRYQVSVLSSGCGPVSAPCVTPVHTTCLLVACPRPWNHTLADSELSRHLSLVLASLKHPRCPWQFLDIQMTSTWHSRHSEMNTEFSQSTKTS